MTRYRTSALLAGAAGLALVCTSLPVAAMADEAPSTKVTGTYSQGNNITWASLADTTFGPGTSASADATITVDPTKTFQRYSGLGISIDETGVSNLWKLPESERRAVIERLVSPTNGAGLDQFRLTIGSPDTIEHLPFYSYDDLPDGVTDDFNLQYFSIQRDIDLHIVETVKLIQEYNPDAKFFGSAWSAPAWMTTTNTFTGYVELIPGSTSFYQKSKLRDDCIDVFAQYYAKFIKAYQAQGIDVQAITVLNEPGMDVVYPAMDISIAQQQKLILAIKAEFARQGIGTDVWVHDFNFWDWRDPGSTATKNYYRIFEDSPDGTVKGADVLAAADGVAFHPYWGDATVMRDANEQTGKPVFMTEAGGFDPGTVLDYMRLNAGTYNAWTQITDQNGGTLHWTDKRDNNVNWTTIGNNARWTNRLVTANWSTGKATYRTNILGGVGQFARYLDQDDVRVQSSNTAGGIANVVYVDSHGNYTAVVRNSNNSARNVKVVVGENSFVANVPNGAYATFRWSGNVPTSESGIPVIAQLPAIGEAEGALAMTIADYGDGIQLSEARNLGDRLALDGALPQVSVTDTRNTAQAAGSGWSVTGRASAFVSGTDQFSAGYLGWRPWADSLRDGVVLGGEVLGTLSGGTGLADPKPLVSAPSGARLGSASVNTDLHLEVPVDTPEGTYTSQLSVSLFPVD